MTGCIATRICWLTCAAPARRDTQGASAPRSLTTEYSRRREKSLPRADSALQGTQVLRDRRQPTLKDVAGTGVAEAEGVLLVEGGAGHHEGAVEVEQRLAQLDRRHRVFVADERGRAGPRPHVMKPRFPGQPLVDQGEVAAHDLQAVSYTHLRAHETRHDLVCRLLLEKKK